MPNAAGRVLKAGCVVMELFAESMTFAVQPTHGFVSLDVYTLKMLVKYTDLLISNVFCCNWDGNCRSGSEFGANFVRLLKSQRGEMDCE